jgi:hypothetical protein
MSQLVRASGLDVSRLLALVANSFTLGFSGAVAGYMSDISTVVALLTMSAIAGHVAKATTRVASLLATTVSSVTETASIVAALGAIACDMADLAAFVAFLAAAGSTIVVIARTSLGTLARNVSSNTAAVARLLLGSYCTLAADMALATTVIASRSSLLRTIASLMRGIAAVEASTTSSLIFHF